MTIHESTPSNQELFDSELDQAICNALDGYAKDGEAWLAARVDFHDAISAGATQDEALFIALDAAKEGAESDPEDAAMRFHSALKIENTQEEFEIIGGRQYGGELFSIDTGAEIGVGIKGRKYGIQLGKRAIGFGPRIDNK